MGWQVGGRISARTVSVWNAMVKPIQEEYPGSGRNLKWVMMSLADWANDEGYCWPSIKSIEDWTGLGRRSVQRAIKQAKVLGILKARERVDMSSEYLIVLEKLPHVEKKKRPKQVGPHQQFPEDEELDLFAANDADEPDGTRATQSNTPRHTGTPPAPVDAAPRATLAPKPIIEPPLEPTSGTVSTETVPGDLNAFIEEGWQKLRESNPNIGTLRSLTKPMAKAAKDRAREHMREGESEVDVWREIFDHISRSSFLCGRAKPAGGYDRPMRLTLSFVLRPPKFRDILDGKYSGGKDAAFDPTTGEILGPARTAASETVDRIRQAGKR